MSGCSDVYGCGSAGWFAQASVGVDGVVFLGQCLGFWVKVHILVGFKVNCV